LDESMTSYIYMLPLGGVVRKPWGASNHSFPCCWGSLSESFSKLSDSIYFQSPVEEAIFINLFVSSSISMRDFGMAIHQEASFLSNVTTKITVKRLPEATHASGNFTMKIRVPSWLRLQGSVTVNGAPIGQITRGTYVSIQRAWLDGDVVDVFFPPSLWTAPLNDYHPEYNATVAFMYGPLVLAGVDVSTDIFIPRGIEFMTNPASFIRRNSTTSLEFEVVSADGDKMRMIPLHDVMLEDYVVYFYTSGTKPVQPHHGYCPHSSQDSLVTHKSGGYHEDLVERPETGSTSIQSASSGAVLFEYI